MAEESFEVHRFRGNGRNPLAFFQIRSALRRLQPDVLHYNDPHAVTAAGLACVGLGIGARVAARHLCFPVRWPLRYRALCDRVVCVAHAAARVCRESGIPSEAIRVVHGGIDPTQWQHGDRDRARAALDVRDGDRLLLTVAQFVPCKGHATLLEAMASVVPQHPEVRAAFAGDGPLRDSLQETARQLGIASRVRFLGHRSDVPDLLAAADLFVLPSLSEALPVTLMEAMLAGCPIVTTDAGGIGDLVGAQGSDPPVAWIVPAGDSHALASAMVQALDDPVLRADRIARAQRRAADQFTADRMVDGTLGVYREALGRG